MDLQPVAELISFALQSCPCSLLSSCSITSGLCFPSTATFIFSEEALRACIHKKLKSPPKWVTPFCLFRCKFTFEYISTSLTPAIPGPASTERLPIYNPTTCKGRQRSNFPNPAPNSETNKCSYFPGEKSCYVCS